MEHTLANTVTLARFFAIPVIATLLYVGTPPTLWAATALFTIAAASDWLDGYLARSRNEVSQWGIAMDPIGDKALVVLTLFVLAFFGAFSFLGLVAGFLILFREILISGLREFFMKEGIDTPVTQLAKWKTATQLTAISVFMAGLSGTEATVTWVGEGLLMFAAILTVITGWQYYAGGMAAVKAKAPPASKPRPKAKKS